MNTLLVIHYAFSYLYFLAATEDGLQGVDWDHKTRTKDIYRITAPGHKGWSRNVDSELGNYDFLLGIDVSLLDSSPNPLINFVLQIDFRHPAVREDLQNWGKWILEVILSH